jgi:hypothetical protein
MSQKPPYRFCWWCSKQFWQNKRHRTLETAGGLVYVHSDCATEMKHEGAGWDAGN